jgi:flavodoxin/NAD-dependent dihydropyrimidine dehydrogenase PreA subunit
MPRRTLIVYFSQAGSTRKVAHAIADGLRSQDHHVDLHHLPDGPPPALNRYDALGIGSPVYVFRPPTNVTTYLRHLPALGGLPFFVFIQSAGLEADAGSIARRIVAGRGGREVGFFKAQGADHALPWLRHGHLFAPDHPTDAELEAARAFGVDVAARIDGADYVRTVGDGPTRAIYKLVRLSTNAWLTRHVYSRGFSVRADACTGCGTCIDVCPTGNITADRHGRPVWGRDCLVCGYCDLRCPVEAVRSPLRWPLFAPFLNAIERIALADPAVGRAPVRIEGGEVVRLEKPRADPTPRTRSAAPPA